MKNSFFKMDWIWLPHLNLLPMGIRRMPIGTEREKLFHEHTFSELVLILNAGEETIHWSAGRSCSLRRGDVLLMHPGCFHGYENVQELELVNLLYDTAQLPIPLLDGPEMKYYRLFLDPSLPREAPEKPIAHLDESQTIAMDMAYREIEEEFVGNRLARHLRIFGMFVALFVDLCRLGGESDRMDDTESIFVAIKHINQHVSESLDLDKLARLCNMSRSSFFRHFREFADCTPGEYQMRKRLEMAEELLRKSTMTLSQVAQACGFCDSSYLSKMFRKKNGMTPREFRKTK